jgi:hypothetical protein
LAQLRFTGDHNDGDLLSFVPRTYTWVTSKNENERQFWNVSLNKRRT